MNLMMLTDVVRLTSNRLPAGTTFVVPAIVLTLIGTVVLGGVQLLLLVCAYGRLRHEKRERVSKRGHG